MTDTQTRVDFWSKHKESGNGSPRDSSYYMEKLDELHSLCYAGLGHKELVDRVYHITWGALYGTPYERG